MKPWWQVAKPHRIYAKVSRMRQYSLLTQGTYFYKEDPLTIGIPKPFLPELILPTIGEHKIEELKTLKVCD